MSAEEDGKVSIKILSTTEKKYREYRMDKKLQKDRVFLCKVKNEATRLISERIKNRNSQIGEFERCIKQWRKSIERWTDLKSSVNSDNEDFLLDVLQSTEEEVENFEQENFFSNERWTKMKKISELSEEELRKLRGDEENGANHSEWINQATASREPSEVSPISSSSVSPNSVASLAIPASKSTESGGKEAENLPLAPNQEVHASKENGHAILPSANPESDLPIIISNAIVKDLIFKEPQMTSPTQDTPISDTQRESTQNLQDNDGKPLNDNPIAPKVQKTATGIEKKNKEIVNKKALDKCVKAVEESNVNVAIDLAKKPKVESVQAIMPAQVNGVHIKKNVQNGVAKSSSQKPHLDKELYIQVASSSSTASGSPLEINQQHFPKLTDPPPVTPKRHAPSPKTPQKHGFSGKEQIPLPVVEGVLPPPTNIWAKRLAEQQEKEKQRSELSVQKPVVVSTLNPNAVPFTPMSLRNQEMDKNEKLKTAKQNKRQMNDGKKQAPRREQSQTVDSEGFITPKRNTRVANETQPNDYKPKEYAVSGQSSKSASPAPSSSSSQQKFAWGKPQSGLVKPPVGLATVAKPDATEKAPAAEAGSAVQSPGKTKTANVAKPVPAPTDPLPTTTAPTASLLVLPAIVPKPDNPVAKVSKAIGNDTQFASTNTNENTVSTETTTESFDEPASTSETPVTNGATDSGVLQQTTKNNQDKNRDQQNGQDNQRRRSKKQKIKKENSGETHEEMIANERKKKEAKRVEEFKARQKSLQEIREQRERDHEERRNQVAKDNEIQRYAQCLQRLKEHEMKTEFHYRYLGAVLFLDPRLKDLEADKLSLISRQKFENLTEQKSKLDLVEEMSSFIMFIDKIVSVSPPETARYTIGELTTYLDITTIRADNPALTEVEKRIQAEYNEHMSQKPDSLKLANVPDYKRKSENLLGAIKFSHVAVAKFSETPRNQEEKTESEKMINIFNVFQCFHEETIELINKLSYLHTQRKKNEFLMEEDCFFGLLNRNGMKSVDWNDFAAPEAVEISQESLDDADKLKRKNIGRTDESANCNKENVAEALQKSGNEDAVETADNSCQTEDFHEAGMAL